MRLHSGGESSGVGMMIFGPMHGKTIQEELWIKLH
jgi:hypothetical protein